MAQSLLTAWQLNTIQKNSREAQKNLDSDTAITTE